MNDTVASVMVPAASLAPTDTGEAAFKLFSADPDLLVCAVVDRGRPVGLLTRDRFFLRMADRFGRDLYSRRPVTFVMQQDPLAVEHDTKLEQLNAHILSARPAALLDGFVVTVDGFYAGVGSTLSLFRAAVDATRERSARLERLAGELSIAERRARQSAEAKGEFLATMSHEIRTPLNGVLGLSALLMRGELAPEHKRLAQTIHDSGMMLLTLLNDILDLSKIEAGAIALRPEPFALESLAGEMRDLWGAKAQEAGLSYRVQAQPADAALEADLSRIRQVLLNLIGNALKFTPRGAVDVRLLLEPCSLPGQARLRIEVQDTGIGIAPDARASIFQAFQQADSKHTRRYGGTGLGLTICERLVGLMQGEIGLSSEPGEGSLFWVELPVRRAGSQFTFASAGQARAAQSVGAAEAA
jgi:signal transduction histidine kinase